MKKLLTFVVLAVASIAANAGYLYWQAPTTSQAGITGSYNYATLWTSTDNGSSYNAISDVSGSTLYFDATTANDTDVGNATHFYIELVNYESGTGSFNVVGKSDAETYSNLSASYHSNLATDLSRMTAWVGSNYQAVPEPTSGLLMLMGFAMLGLKRKKEV